MRKRWRRTRARVRVVRSRVRRTPAGRIAWRAGVGLIGGIVLLVGVIAIPGPGQGWAMVFLGLAILSTEFSWATAPGSPCGGGCGRGASSTPHSHRGRARCS
jgi:uncharacterized protein (TIGR02611 family)